MLAAGDDFAVVKYKYAVGVLYYAHTLETIKRLVGSTL